MPSIQEIRNPIVHRIEEIPAFSQYHWFTGLTKLENSLVDYLHTEKNYPTIPFNSDIKGMFASIEYNGELALAFIVSKDQRRIHILPLFEIDPKHIDLAIPTLGAPWKVKNDLHEIFEAVKIHLDVQAKDEHCMEPNVVILQQNLDSGRRERPFVMGAWNPLIKQVRTTAAQYENDIQSIKAALNA